ncbi:MAG TPA: hypothetical protein VFA52_03965 [Candidatus Paceibacterota bacterium]|jgi:hypothetical protein|nr:hypothetical protein [Candidatus Paceibacterota bacterium]
MAKKKHAGHGYHRTHIEHHHDGSATVHHVHEDGPEHDRKHAVANLDKIHDSIQDHLGQPNPGEAEADMGNHGIPAEQATAAGVPVVPSQTPQMPGA